MDDLDNQQIIVEIMEYVFRDYVIKDIGTSLLLSLASLALE